MGGGEGKASPAAHVRYSLDEHERSELPLARIDSGGTPPRLARGATPAHVRYSLDEHERSELPQARLARGATPQALGLQSPPGVWYAKQNPREECLL